MTTKIVRAFRRAAVPLTSYYMVTLGLPLANGAAGAGATFARHALAVLVAPPILIGLACAARVLLESAHKARN